MSKREDRMKEITDRLQAGLEELFQSEKYAQYLKVMSQFHHYSINNTLLIAMQKPDATLVAGYHAWERKFKRHVMKGAKGIQIIAPMPVKEKREHEKTDPRTGELLIRDDGQPETEVVTLTIPRFRVTTVFDLAQTEGEPLPELGVQELTANVENYELFIEAIRTAAPVPIRFDEIAGEAKGYYDNNNKEIVIKAGMGELQTIKTAIHETAHAILHDRDIMKQEGIEKDQMTKECEAESVAFVVLSHFGPEDMDTSEYSFPYIAGWSSSREMKEVKQSLDTIRKTASDLIDSIESSIREQVLIHETTITFFVAECMKFPVMGDYQEVDTLQEAVKVYEAMPNGRINGGKGIGFNLDDGTDYSGAYPLVQGGMVITEIAGLADYYKENPVVQAAVQEAKGYFPEKPAEEHNIGADQRNMRKQKESVLANLRTRQKQMIKNSIQQKSHLPKKGVQSL